MEFQSNIELIEYVKKFQISLIETGNKEENNEINEGMSSLNGLTDGWAALLESIIVVKTNFESGLNKNQIIVLNNIIKTLHNIVYRS